MSTPPLVDSRKDASDQSTTYKTVQLKDGNIWLAENYNYYISRQACQSFGGFRTDEEARKDTGLYYDWEPLTPDVLPPGWHIPSVDEWTAMVNCYGGFASAYDALVEGGSSGLNLGIDGGTYYKEQACHQLAQDLGMYWTSSAGRDEGFSAMIQLKRREKKMEVLYLHVEYRFNVRLVKNK